MNFIILLFQEIGNSSRDLFMLWLLRKLCINFINKITLYLNIFKFINKMDKQYNQPRSHEILFMD